MFTLTNLPRIHHYGGFSGFERLVDIGGIDHAITNFDFADDIVICYELHF